jgi:transposase InsO family protein
VGSVCDSYDNARAETINGLYKAEVIHRVDHGAHSRRSSSPLLNGSTGFNNRRLLQPIGNIPPAEAEGNYYEALEEMDIAA